MSRRRALIEAAGPRKRRARRLHRAQRGRCAYCHRPMDPAPGSSDRPRGITVDHVVPLSRGGTDADENVVGACWACNQRKGDGTWDDAAGIAQGA
jgi:5-methylcytosine-specific restriction endonuclease McrA